MKLLSGFARTAGKAIPAVWLHRPGLSLLPANWISKKPAEREGCEFSADFGRANAAFRPVPLSGPVQHPQDPQRGQTEIEFGSQEPFGDSVSNEVRPLLLVAVVEPLDFSELVRGQLEPLEERD